MRFEYVLIDMENIPSSMAEVYALYPKLMDVDRSSTLDINAAKNDYVKDTGIIGEDEAVNVLKERLSEFDGLDYVYCVITSSELLVWFEACYEWLEEWDNKMKELFPSGKASCKYCKKGFDIKDLNGIECPDCGKPMRKLGAKANKELVTARNKRENALQSIAESSEQYQYKTKPFILIGGWVPE